MNNSLDHGVDHDGPVINCFDLHSGRQFFLVELFNLLIDPCQCGQGLGVTLQKDHTFHRVFRLINAHLS